MEIPINAQVACSDGNCGRSKYVLINPVLDEVTHLVVKDSTYPNKEYIVPIEKVSETINDTILLRCSKAELENMEPFIQTEYIKDVMPDYDHVESYSLGAYVYAPEVIPDTTLESHIEHQQIPPGELAVRRGTRVEATDGYVGTIDEFMVNPENDHITHLILREGHLWGQKDVFIPVSAMDKYRKDILTLKIDKHQIESLPTFKVHRLWA